MLVVSDHLAQKTGVDGKVCDQVHVSLPISSVSLSHLLRCQPGNWFVSRRIYHVCPLYVSLITCLRYLSHRFSIASVSTELTLHCGPIGMDCYVISQAQQSVNAQKLFEFNM